MATVKVPIEVDVTCVNQGWPSHRKKKDNTKHYVIGFLKRSGKASISVLDDNKPETIHKAVLENVETGCTLYAHENILPETLKDVYDIQELKESEHVSGDVHINNLKSMWRDLKRQIKREHVSVSKKHLQGYCNEVAWRVNTRDFTPMEKFNMLLSNCGKRLTYDSLTKK